MEILWQTLAFAAKGFVVFAVISATALVVFLLFSHQLALFGRLFPARATVPEAA